MQPMCPGCTRDVWRTRRDSNPRLLPPERGDRRGVSPTKDGANANLWLVCETPESTDRRHEIPQDRAHSGPSLEAFWDAAFAAVLDAR
jgi:hypothetical protein